jgi:dihydrodiol dehydrogenase / D-xylose 1-dehydrogenase (NADP)
MFSNELGGGGLLDIGCYTIDAATMAFEGRALGSVLAQGEIGPTGVDHAGNVILTYEGAGSASLLYSLRANTLEQTMIYGTEGHLKIHSPAHCPSKLTVTQWGSADRGGGEEAHVETLDFPLDDPADGESYNYPNQQGFRHAHQPTSCSKHATYRMRASFRCSRRCLIADPLSVVCFTGFFTGIRSRRYRSA